MEFGLGLRPRRRRASRIQLHPKPVCTTSRQMAERRRLDQSRAYLFGDGSSKCAFECKVICGIVGLVWEADSPWEDSGDDGVLQLFEIAVVPMHFDQLTRFTINANDLAAHVRTRNGRGRWRCLPTGLAAHGDKCSWRALVVVLRGDPVCSAFDCRQPHFIQRPGRIQCVRCSRHEVKRAI